MAALVEYNSKNDLSLNRIKGRTTRLLVMAVSAIMVISVMTALMGSNGEKDVSNALNVSTSSAPGNIGSAVVSTAEPLDAGTVMDALSANNVPLEYAYLPNFMGASSGGSSVAPFYTTSPAPMGIADYGLMAPSGINVPYAYNTSGFDGTVMIEGLEPFNPMNNDPGNVSVQLNTVLDQVTIQGNAGKVFWVHSVALYDPSAGTVQLINNIWGISSTSFSFEAGSILQGNGVSVPGLFYYDVGPVLNVPATFTLDLFVSTELFNNNNEVTFGYEISNTESSYLTSGTYDTVVFNSTAAGSSSITPAAVFHVDGFKKTPSGLLYDAELVAGGPGGGSTTAVSYSNNQFKLKFLDGTSSSYSNVPAAYNYGSNTAETVSGISVWWTSQMNPIAHLSSGPSLFVKLWGSSQTGSGATNIQGVIDPPNSFMFINIGSTYDASKAAWAPLPANGTYKFALPGKLDYSGAVVLSEYDPYYFDTAAYAGNETEGGGPPGNNTTETTTHFNVTLAFDYAKGIYTPLYASGNAQVPVLTVGNSVAGTVKGSGTESDPYIIENNENNVIDPLFSHTNAYMFPEFSGIQISGTDAYILVADPPSFSIHYSSSMYGYLTYYGLPSDNNMNMVFYETSGVTLYGAAQITGWFASILNGFALANVEFIDSTDFLVAGNDFSGMGSSLLIHNGPSAKAGGTVWGNHFLPNDITGSAYAQKLMFGKNPTGISVYSSGNLIYNNYFDISRSANSPGKDPFSGIPVVYSNDWNLTSKMPLTYVNTVNNFELYGSIVNVQYQGGNYWYDFNGVIPYNDLSNIAVGGDYYPLILPTYNVTFANTGLPSGLDWGVTLHGRTMASQGMTTTFKVPNGTYTFSISKPSVYAVSPVSGTVFVDGQEVTVNLTFTLVVYEITFAEKGLPIGTLWGVNLNGLSPASTNASISVMKENGTYDFSITGPSSYSAFPFAGTVIVDGSNVTQNVTFTYIEYPVVFVETGLPDGTNWTVNFNGMNYTVNTDSRTFMKLNGTYSYSIYAPDDYSASPSSGDVMVYGETVYVDIEFSLNHYNVVFQYDGLDSGTLWEVTFNNQTQNSTSGQIVFNVPNGNYTYKVTQVQNYKVDVTDGYLVVDHGDASKVVHFTKNPNYLLTIGIIAGGIAVGIVAGYGIFRWYSKRPKQ